MAEAKITVEKVAECYKRVGTKNGVARELEIDQRNLRRFWDRHEEEINGLIENCGECEVNNQAKKDEVKPEPIPEFKSKEVLVAETKDKLLSRHKQKMLDDLIKERAIANIIIDKCLEAVQALPELEITPITFSMVQKFREHEAVLQISDIQAGTYISLEATGGLNEYNKDILKLQFQKLTDSMTSIITKQKQVLPIRKLNIHMLGDMVEGMGIFIGQAQHVDQDLYEQFFGLAELLVEFLVEMLFLFDEIEVSAIGGNHGAHRQEGRKSALC